MSAAGILQVQKLAVLPVCFTGQDRWLRENGTEQACRMFDQFGWRDDWVRLSEIAAALFPHLSYPTRRNYTRALVAMLVAQGRETRNPQLVYRHGKVSFDVQGVS